MVLISRDTFGLPVNFVRGDMDEAVYLSMGSHGLQEDKSTCAIILVECNGIFEGVLDVA